MQLLSENAIMHISAGFEGPFILQAFGVRRDLYCRGVYNFCLTDGAVYIGARYECQQDIELDNYNLVQITAKFEDRFHPIIIKTLDLISTSLKKLVGNPPCTLQDYFNRQTKCTGSESLPSKKIKLNEEGFSPPPHKFVESKKAAKQGNSWIRSAQKDEEQVESQKKKKTVINLQMVADKKRLKLASESQEQEIKKQSKEAILIGQDSNKSISKSPPIMNYIKQRELQKTCEISDLYERSTGWVILCRVKHTSTVPCSNGLFAVNFIITDAAGGQIKCVYFINDQDSIKDRLIVGKYYLFTGGEVKYVQKEKELQITFDKNSDIVPHQDAYFPPLPGNYIRIDKIIDLKHLAIANIVGVVRKIKSKQTFKTKIKYTGTLCDPIKHIQIDFMLFLNSQQKVIKPGMVIILNNYQIFSQQSIFRLNSTYKSYYCQQQPRQGDLIDQFANIVQTTDWQSQNYKNISMFAFTQRTISDLRDIFKRTDDERIYSALDVWVLDIARKKSYNACIFCKKPTEKKQLGIYDCQNCKKMVDTIVTHALSVTIADFTGSYNIDVIGQHAQNLLGMKAIQFSALTPEEHLSHLQSLKYKNMNLRLKSQRKGQKKESHSVWGIERPTPEVTLRQIRKRMHLNRLKQQQW